MTAKTLRCVVVASALLFLGWSKNALAAVEVKDTQSVAVSETLPRQEFGPVLLPLPEGFTVGLELNITHKVTMTIGSQSFAFEGKGGAVAGGGTVALEKVRVYDVTETYTFAAGADAVFLQANFPVKKEVRWKLTAPESGEYACEIVGAARSLAIKVEGDLTGVAQAATIGETVALEVSTARNVAAGEKVGYTGSFAVTLDRTATAKFNGVVTPPTEEPKPPEWAKRLDAALKTAIEQLASLAAEIQTSGFRLAYARLMELLNASIVKTQASLLTGDLDGAEDALDRVDDILESLQKELHFRTNLKDVQDEFAELQKSAKATGVELPKGSVAELDTLLKRAEDMASKNRFKDAERLVADADKVLDEIRKDLKTLEKKAKEVASEATKAAAAVKEAAAAAVEAAKKALDARGNAAADALKKALEACRDAAEKASDVEEKAKDAKERGNREGRKDAVNEADAAEDEAIAAVLTAAKNVADAAARLAENAEKAAESARNAFEGKDVPARRAAEAALEAAENAAEQVAEAAALVAENTRRAAEKAAEKAKATGDAKDKEKADGLAKEAAEAAKDAAEKEAEAAELVTANLSATADTDALHAANIAAAALRKSARDAQKLAQEAAKAVKAAEEKAAKAAQEAERAAQKAKESGEAAKRAAEKAKEAAQKAKEAAETAAKEAKKAGKKACDLNDDGDNNILDIILVARVFGSLTVKLDIEASISDINGDGEVNISDLVYAAQGLFDGAVISGLEGLLAAPAQTPNVVWRWTPQEVNGAYRTVRLDLVGENLSAAQGFQFDLAYDPTVMEVVEVGDGNILNRDGTETYRLSPNVSDGHLTMASARLASEGVSGPGVLGSVLFRLESEAWRSRNPLREGAVKVADSDGRISESRFSEKSFDFASALPPLRPRLMQNFPNPFNPETWIPFELKESSEVVIGIYDSEGRLVRTLSLGRQPAGYYAGRDKAAYWDGANETGEQVASGTYFYTLHAGTYSETRKLLVMK